MLDAAASTRLRDRPPPAARSRPDSLGSLSILCAAARRPDTSRCSLRRCRSRPCLPFPARLLRCATIPTARPGLSSSAVDGPHLKLLGQQPARAAAPLHARSLRQSTQHPHAAPASPPSRLALPTIDALRSSPDAALSAAAPVRCSFSLSSTRLCDRARAVAVAAAARSFLPADPRCRRRASRAAALRSPSGRCPTPRDQSPLGRCPRRRRARVRARGARGVSQVSSLLLAAPRRRGLQSPLGRRVARDLRRRRRSRGPAALPQLSGLPRAAARRQGTSLLQAAALAAGGRARAHRRPTACRRSTVSFRPLPNAEVSSLPWAAALRGCGEARGQATGARAVGRLLLGPRCCLRTRRTHPHRALRVRLWAGTAPRTRAPPLCGPRSIIRLARWRGGRFGPLMTCGGRPLS